MKKLKYLVLLAFVFTACKKDTHNDVATIVGQWEWIKTTGGAYGVYYTPQNTGRTWKLTLNSDLTIFQSGNLTSNESGVYTKTEEINSWGTIPILRMIFPSHLQSYHYVISSDTLRLNEYPEADGFSYYLVKNH